MQKACYTNKLIIDQEILDKIRNRHKHQSLAALLTIEDVATKCILTDLKRMSKTLVYDIMSSTRKTKRGLCNLCKLINISTIL